MDESLFEESDIADLISEVGHQLLFLNRSISIPRDTDRGSPGNYTWKRTPITAYVTPEARRIFFLSPGATPVGSGDYIAYIQPSASFSLDLLSSETFVEWEGQSYSLEQRESVFHRGRIYLYKFKLKRTQDQAIIPAVLPPAQRPVAWEEVEPPPELGQWVDLQAAASIGATTQANLSLVKVEAGFKTQNVYDWSAWVQLNQVYDLGQARIVVEPHDTSLVGVAPESSQFDDFPQSSFTGGVYFKKAGSGIVISSLLCTDQNFYALQAPLPLTGPQVHLLFFAAGAELVVEVSEFIDGTAGDAHTKMSLGPLPESRRVQLAAIAPHGSLTLVAHS